MYTYNKCKIVSQLYIKNKKTKQFKLLIMYFHVHATQLKNKIMDYSLCLSLIPLNKFELETFSLSVHLCSVSQSLFCLNQLKETFWLTSCRGKNLVSGHENTQFKFLTLTVRKTKPKKRLDTHSLSGFGCCVCKMGIKLPFFTDQCTFLSSLPYFV